MTADYQQFIMQIKKKTGIDLALYKEAQMKRRLESLRDKRGYSTFLSYYQALAADSSLFHEFLERMTINVSEFYRNKKRWEVLEEKILPRLLAENSKPKLWSAACSTGEEPYTLAMIMASFMPLSEVSILATDLDKEILKRAQVGFYTDRSLKEVPPGVLSRYFTKELMGYKVSDQVKRAVTFKQQNLLSDSFGTQYDLIICRNVMIYFTEEAKHELYQKFSQALRPGGVLFVGSTEQIFHADQYHFETEDTFFYKKKG
ncbi:MULTISPECIES: CheR family methyltransferase [Alkalihalophilus]|uniref:protein-glutamate O-methyltransferase n=2 Tax=Alkalihalophilus pseudofirmus TaxID=79885 RepID=D3G050_ALKPO|nr:MULTISPECIES: protein-glutamate O-methyltransferase CheR [Alkalihalophilus]ADC51135.1 Methyl-accepting chemotaxis protein (MCP) methyltransferase [Alkalihalophilus pseudofirmus OF4]MDV2884328.1 protein-glutamate O-methyltransferase CheR [Alkalihalophilus pseudofirmus]MEC2070817.1 protein-glutamate O-methyltransferase CheR [Alkalihalophilus marmarensis]MED1601506.1 protein-glutamate O-methyltransferase CheR [Alkalihalophilus marmarensis]WEG18347.1 protein-glutamate O-methyltransferase CheR [